MRRLLAALAAASLTAAAGCGGVPSTRLPVAARNALAAAAARWKERRLHSFDYSDGAYDIYAGLVSDPAGNLYGTTQSGGETICDYDESCGVVFELKRAGNGKWRESVLHDFAQCNALGFWPRSGLIMDTAGNLYGTTSTGGPDCSGVGPGVVYELSPSSGSWTAKVLYRFIGGIDGSDPGALTFGPLGSLYGITAEGGFKDDGTIFKLTPQRGRSWTKTILHSFTRDEGDGPEGKLAVDPEGNLYGTTDFGGAYRSGCGGYGCGTAYELKPGTSGTWTLTVLHSFGKGVDGAKPSSGVILDSAGNLFGTTNQGGVRASAVPGTCLGYGCGTVYKLTRAKAAKWPERILHYFGLGTDGNSPEGALVFDARGALYGTTAFGARYGAGNAFRLARDTGDKWQETVLHNFGKDRDGAYPYSGMIFDRAGNLYGTTDAGGYEAGACQKSRGCGTIFEIAPRAP